MPWGCGISVQATSSFIIFDEVDEMYAPTLRTSAARRLCQLCDHLSLCQSFPWLLHSVFTSQYLTLTAKL